MVDNSNNNNGNKTIEITNTHNIVDEVFIIHNIYVDIYIINRYVRDALCVCARVCIILQFLSCG